jgi:hypothetical protein
MKLGFVVVYSIGEIVGIAGYVDLRFLYVGGFVG